MQPEPSNPPAAPRRSIRRHAVRALIVSICCLVPASAVVGDEPAPSNALLELVPADSALVVTVDHLREQWRAILDSRLARDVQKLPAFKAWLDTDKVRDFLRSRAQIEAFLRTSLGEVGDEIFGDAVVLALRLPSESTDPSKARGLLVLKARDPKLLNRLVELINTTQRQNGEIAELSEQKRGAVVYHTRTFHDGDDRLPESFVIFPDGTFAFSNDERLIHEVVDRKTAAAEAPASGSVADREGFQAMSARLPSRTVARLFIEPKTARRLLGGVSARPSTDDHDWTAMADRYIDGLDSIGAALVIDDHEIKLQAIQAFEPERFRESIGARADEPSTDQFGTRLFAVPGSATALLALDVDFPTLYHTLINLVPTPDRPKIAKLETLGSGLLLGLDVRRQVLPALGSRVVAYLEPPDFSATKPRKAAGPGRFPFPFVIAAEIDDEAGGVPDSVGSPTVAAALDNALNTMLAALAFDKKHVPADARVQTVEVDGVAVRSLSTPLPFAYAVDRPGRRLILGNSPEVVTRYIEAGADPKAGARFQAIHAAAFPNYESYACLDLAAIRDLAVQHRDRLIEAMSRNEHRPADDVGRDLDQVLGLVQLFDAAFLSVRVDVKNASLEHNIGLLLRPADHNR